jgi:hypothetical protein
MTIAVRDLNTLDPDNVAQGLAEVSARIQEQNPNLDLRRGVLHDLLAYFHALLAEQLDANVQDYLAARSVLAIQEDPTLSDPALVDDVLSNFGVTRKQGTFAKGEVAVVVSADVTLTLAAGFAFQAHGQTFVTDQVYTAKAEASQINSANDRLLSPLDDGTFRFTVFVDAQAEGPAGQLAKDALLTPTSLPANYVTSYAVSSFTGGQDTETNQELIVRLQQGIACKAPSNRVNIQAMLRQIDAFSRIVATSVIGMGDAEMLRDKHWIFPVGGGGRVDVYVRSEEKISYVLLQKTATCVSVDAAAGTSVWQLALTRDDAPGFYELTDVARLGAAGQQGGLAVVSETRAADLTGPGYKPDVVSAVEWDYSRFVTAVLQFTDDGPGQETLAPGAQADYQLQASYLPLIDQVQDTLLLPDVRSRVADVLVRAPVPCFVTLAFTVYKVSGQDDPDLDGIKTDLCAAVNQVAFTGQLFAGQLQAAIAPYLLDGQQVGSIDMLGRIRYPGGAVAYVRSSEVLDVPDQPDLLVSARTVQFFIDVVDVGITVVTSVPSGT